MEQNNDELVDFVVIKGRRKMMTIEIKINNVPIDRFDIVNKGIRPPESTKHSYEVTHYNYEGKSCEKFMCAHLREEGRFKLASIVMGYLDLLCSENAKKLRKADNQEIEEILKSFYSCV